MDRTSPFIQISNVRGVMKALQEFEPELKKRVTLQIRTALGNVRNRAFTKYPDGQWSIQVNQKRILGSIIASGGGYRASSWGESGPGVRAAIFEFAGSVQGGKTPQARGLINHLNEKYGQPGRFLWSAWDETGQQALNEIVAAVHAAERDLQGKLDAQGEGF